MDQDLGLNRTAGGLPGLRVDERPGRTRNQRREEAKRGLAAGRRAARGDTKALVMRRVEAERGGPVGD